MENQVTELYKIGENRDDTKHKWCLVKFLENGIEKIDYVSLDDVKIFHYIDNFRENLEKEYTEIIEEETEKSRSERFRSNLKAVPFYLIGLAMFLWSGYPGMYELLSNVLGYGSFIYTCVTIYAVNNKSNYMDDETKKILARIQNKLKKITDLEQRATLAITKKKEKEKEEENLKRMAQKRKQELEMELYIRKLEEKRKAIQNSKIHERNRTSIIFGDDFEAEKPKKTGESNRIPDYLRRDKLGK